MNNTIISPARRSAILALLLLYSATPVLWAQTKYRSASAAVTVAGTSTLHDWKETSNKGSANAVFVVSQNKISGVPLLVFTLPVKSLKSEHTSMDNNTYKALKADKNPEIAYILSTATVTLVNATTFTVKTRGKMTIAGTTRETEVDGTARLNADNSITVSGSKKISMTDFNVTPPKVMMIRTGNDVTVSFTLRFVK